STRLRYWFDRNSSLASQSSSIFSSASAAAMVDSGTTQAPARKPPMKVSIYSTELAARMAILSPLPTPMPANERAIWVIGRAEAGPCAAPAFADDRAPVGPRRGIARHAQRNRDELGKLLARGLRHQQ